MNEVPEKTFRPPSTQRGEGQPSPALKEHLRQFLGADVFRHGSKVSTDKIMLALFCWFFDDATLKKIAQFTNDKAQEKVHKINVVREDGKIFTKVINHSILFIMHTYIFNTYNQYRWSIPRGMVASNRRGGRAGARLLQESSWSGLESPSKWARWDATGCLTTGVK